MVDDLKLDHIIAISKTIKGGSCKQNLYLFRESHSIHLLNGLELVELINNASDLLITAKGTYYWALYAEYIERCLLYRDKYAHIPSRILQSIIERREKGADVDSNGDGNNDDGDDGVIISVNFGKG